MFRSYIAGLGSHLPTKKLTNHDLEQLVETSDQWIMERTGIKSRSIAEDGQRTSDLAYFAAIEAMKNAKVEPNDIDMVIFATVTPDRPMPSTACYLQARLGISTEAMVFDIAAACTGWIYGTTIADQFIRNGTYKNVLIVGAEILSHKVDYKDRGTCILFGDGAGASIVSRTEDDKSSLIFSGHNHADGSQAELLSVPSGGSADPVSQTMIDERSHYIAMQGREIFKHAVRSMAKASMEALEANKMTIEDIDWVIPHQANLRIMEAVSKQLKVSMDKFIVHIEDMGNTSAATIPVTFNHAIETGKIKKGDVILCTAFGAGLTSGSLLVRY